MVEMIKHWSKSFGLPIKEEKGFPSQDRIDLALSLIQEEFEELQEAVKNRDLTETQDALGDLLWVTIRKMLELGIDPQETIESIYTSNMSKSDATEDDAMKTFEMYKQKGIQTYMRQKGDRYLTYRTADNKVLKSHLFQEPKFK